MRYRIRYVPRNFGKVPGTLAKFLYDIASISYTISYAISYAISYSLSQNKYDIVCDIICDIVFSFTK